jgi:hypothetical protein
MQEPPSAPARAHIHARTVQSTLFAGPLQRVVRRHFPFPSRTNCRISIEQVPGCGSFGRGGISQHGNSVLPATVVPTMPGQTSRVLATKNSFEARETQLGCSSDKGNPG